MPLRALARFGHVAELVPQTLHPTGTEIMSASTARRSCSRPGKMLYDMVDSHFHWRPIAKPLMAEVAYSWCSRTGTETVGSIVSSIVLVNIVCSTGELLARSNF